MCLTSPLFLASLSGSVPTDHRNLNRDEKLNGIGDGWVVDTGGKGKAVDAANRGYSAVEEGPGARSWGGQRRQQWTERLHGYRDAEPQWRLQLGRHCSCPGPRGANRRCSRLAGLRACGRAQEGVEAPRGEALAQGTSGRKRTTCFARLRRKPAVVLAVAGRGSCPSQVVVRAGAAGGTAHPAAVAAGSIARPSLLRHSGHNRFEAPGRPRHNAPGNNWQGQWWPEEQVEEAF